MCAIFAENTLKTRMYAILTPLKGLTIQGSYG